PARRPNPGNEIQLTFGGRPEIAPGMAFTPDSKSLVAAATAYNQQQAVRFIKVLDVATGKEVRKISVPEGAAVSALAVAPDGKITAYGAGNTIRVCDVDSGKEIRQLSPADGGAMAMAFALDGKTLAVRGRNHRVRLWETQTGKELHQLGDSELSQRTSGLAFL